MSIKVLIVDDSKFMRKILRSILEKDEAIEVIGEAANPYEARELIAKQKPDVMTLDIEMPAMDGLTFLEKIMEYFPIPVVIISSLSTKGSDTAMRAIELGAVGVLAKPKNMDMETSFKEISAEIIETVKGASFSKRISKLNFITKDFIKNGKKNENSDFVVAIGASTGGPEAVYLAVKDLPENFPGVVVVIHMPEGFTKSYAERLNATCQMEVKEAADGDKICKGRILIAPGSFQTTVQRSKTGEYYVSVKKEKLYNNHRPSVDVMFFSVADNVAAKSLGVILTGMGKDGAEGLLKMRENGAYTIAQNEKTSVVFGMPKVAIDIGGVNEVLPIERISKVMIERLRKFF